MKKTQYLDMIGKYVRMERPATPEERAAGDAPTIGMECVVAKVEFGGHDSVTIVADYGYGFLVTPDTEDQWKFTVWPDEETAVNEQKTPAPAAEWLAKARADPDAREGEITDRAARAVFAMVRRYDATGVSGWE